MRGGGAGALRGCGAARVPRRLRVQALPASRSGPGWPRLLKALASAPAPPLARCRDAPQSGAVGPRPEATGSSPDPGGRERSGVGFINGGGGSDLRRLPAPSRGGCWEEEARGQRVWVRQRVRGAQPRRREGGRGSSRRPRPQVIFLRLVGGSGAGRAGGGAGAGPDGPGRGRTLQLRQAEARSAPRRSRTVQRRPSAGDPGEWARGAPRWGCGRARAPQKGALGGFRAVRGGRPGVDKAQASGAARRGRERRLRREPGLGSLIDAQGPEPRLWGAL